MNIRGRDRKDMKQSQIQLLEITKMLEMKNTALTEQHTHIIEKYTCESNGVLTSNY